MKQSLRARFSARAAAGVASIVSLPLVLATKAQAEVPAGVTTAITDAGEDMVTTITAVIVAFVAFWGLRKLASKFGWM